MLTDETFRKGKIYFRLNTDFLPEDMDPALMKVGLEAVQAGLLSHGAFFDLLKRGELIAGSKTFHQELDDIESQVPPPVHDGTTLRELEIDERAVAVKEQLAEHTVSQPTAPAGGGFGANPRGRPP
ncbi:MAG: hypothetical protein ACR2QC_01390 [Gammaproteobacteria bacterium]